MQRNHRSLLRTLQHLTSDGWRARQRRLWLCLSGLLLGALALWFRAPLPGAAAAQADDVWQPLGEQTRGLANQRAGLPRQYRAFRLNQSALDGLLRQAPAEKKGRLEDSPAVLQLPLPSGKLQRFQLEESSVLEPAQAALYPQLKSYRGRGLDDERATVRFSVTPRGLHALLLTADTVVSIQPATPGQTEIYASYYGRDVSERERRFECGVSEFVGTERAANRALAPNDFAVGATLRTYRIAIATTQEYSNDFILGGGTLASVNAALVVWLNNINAVYERELSVHLNLAAGNDNAIKFAEPDGFTNGTLATMINEATTVLANSVGTSNYDVGHVLGFGSGSGQAYLSVVCSTNVIVGFNAIKGGGATLTSCPSSCRKPRS